MDIGKNIKKIRKEKKITLEKLSKKTGFSAGYISQIENGKRKKPSREFIEGIAYGLDVSSTYLTTGRKTLADLTEEEIKESKERAQNNYKKRRADLRNDINKDLSEILDMELGFAEEIFLLNAISFLKKSNTDDLILMTAILQQYNLYENIYHVTNDEKELLEEIKDMQKQIEMMFSVRYGLSKYEEPEKDD